MYQQVKIGGTYGEGSGTIHFEGLDCFGNETDLTHCNIIKRKSCLHIHDAGVVCYRKNGIVLDTKLIIVILLSLIK